MQTVLRVVLLIVLGLLTLGFGMCSLLGFTVMGGNNFNGALLGLTVLGIALTGLCGYGFARLLKAWSKPPPPPPPT